MRRVVILLFVLCSAISGWTPVLAQIGHRLQLAPTAQHSDAGHPHAVATENCCDRDGTGNGCCGKQVHPMLCAACFAIETASPATQGRFGLIIRIASAQPHAMEDSAIEPVHPPPKA